MSKALLVGTPNSGKTALFNRLTGLNQRVANYPGITVDISVGRMKGVEDWDLVDFPGTYSLRSISDEERVAVAHFETSLADTEVGHVMCVVDATRLEKSLFFCLQVIRECRRHNRPMTVVANMGDILKKHRLSIDVEGLSTTLAVPVVLVSARTGEGVTHLLTSLASPTPISEAAPAAEQTPVLASDGASEGNLFPGATLEDRALYEQAHRLAKRYGPAADALLQMGLNVAPGPLNGGVAEQLGPEAIGGEQPRRLRAGGGEQRCQLPSEGGLAAGRGTDQQVAAQGAHRPALSHE